MKFFVAVPAYNRVGRIAEALDSLLAQTHQDWECVVYDDGSTDGTLEVARSYVQRDKRFTLASGEVNRGGVYANEILMSMALSSGCDAWTRLGSDDYFAPHKLAVDAQVFGIVDPSIVYGPYRNLHATFLDETIYGEPCNARSTLLSKGFAASWANIAMRMYVLRDVKDRYGSFCDARIRNMEDFVFNVRAASFHKIVWRGRLRASGAVVSGATSWADTTLEPAAFDYDAIWRVAGDGASNKNDIIANDARLTMETIDRDFAAHPPLVF